MADSTISALADAGALKSGDFFVIDRGAASNKKKALLGYPELIYRYTVTGADKASIDTGVDTADAGTNDWTNGDLLEVWLIARTDEAVVASVLDVTLNNDSSSIYDRQEVSVINTTLAGVSVVAEAAIRLNCHGANGSASYPSLLSLIIPNFTGTTFWKVVESANAVPDATAANQSMRARQYGYRSTSAITRLAVTPETAGKKLKVGSQLLIYKRLAS